MIIIGLILFAISNLLAAFAGDLTLLFVSRLIGGIGSAALIPSIIAYIADITADEQRSKAMSWLGASMTSGFIIGPGVGGLLAEWGIKMPFYVSVMWLGCWPWFAVYGDCLNRCRRTFAGCVVE